MRQLALLALLACLATPAAAHGVYPDQVNGSFAIGERSVAGELRFLPELFDKWLQLKRPHPQLLRDEDKRLASQRLPAFLATALRVTIDGIAVQPVVGAIAIRELDLSIGPVHYITVKIELPVGKPPREARFVWQRYDMLATIPDIAVMLTVEGVQQHDVLLEHTDPEYIWRAERAPSSPVVSAARRPLPPRGPWSGAQRPHRFADGAELLLLLGALLIGWAWRFGWSRGPILTITTLTVVAAIAMSWMAWRHAERPWEPPYVPPSDAEAEQIFRDLQHNIYTAFSYDTEKQVYEALRQSVHGPLLDNIYVEVSRSLILRDQQGARAKMERIEIESATPRVDPSPETRRFEVDCAWRLHGQVVHYGHAHKRVIYHRATYTLRQTAAGWRIVEIDLHQQQVVKRDFTQLPAGPSSAAAQSSAGASSSE